MSKGYVITEGVSFEIQSLSLVNGAICVIATSYEPGNEIIMGVHEYGVYSPDHELVWMGRLPFDLPAVEADQGRELSITLTVNNGVGKKQTNSIPVVDWSY